MGLKYFTDQLIDSFYYGYYSVIVADVEEPEKCSSWHHQQ